VLIVDDEPFIRLGLQDALESEGFAVVEAEDGSTALQALAEMPDVSIMVTDVRMAGMDGLELARIVAERHPRLRIIIMSGHADAHDPRIPAGVQFMRKPFPLLAFADWLRETCSAADG
jgi:two-component system cell cycle sensor histidine kinase/response regulator CckA